MFVLKGVNMHVSGLRRFNLVRDIDHTGVSGTGTVAAGCCFPDNSCVMQWQVTGRPSTLVYYKSIGDVLNLHNHQGTDKEGGTLIEWVD